MTARNRSPKPTKPVRGPWIVEDSRLEFRVGYQKDDYQGPTAQVLVGKEPTPTWLYIITDDYEGVAMVNIETLPMLRRALAKIAGRLITPAPAPKRRKKP